MTPENIISECCSLFGIAVEKITEKNRRQDHVVCMAFISYFMRRHSNLGLTRIGKFIGRDHSCITHLLKNVETYRNMDIVYSRFFISLQNKFTDQKSINICPTCGHVKS